MVARCGSSRQAILKYIMANVNVGKEAKPMNAHLNIALSAGVKNKTLKQSKRTGYSGSFRIGEVKAAKKHPNATKVAKPKATNPKKEKNSKKPVVKKAVGEKKPTTKKTAARYATAKHKTSKSSKNKTIAKTKAKQNVKTKKKLFSNWCHLQQRLFSANKSRFKSYPICSQIIYCINTKFKLNCIKFSFHFLLALFRRGKGEGTLITRKIDTSRIPSFRVHNVCVLFQGQIKLEGMSISETACDIHTLSTIVCFGMI